MTGENCRIRTNKIHSPIYHWIINDDYIYIFKIRDMNDPTIRMTLRVAT